VLALSLVCTSASAQVDPSAISAIQALRDGNVIRQGVPNPLQPTGFPNPPPKRADEDVEGQAFQLISADESEYDGQVVHLRGNVEFVARGYRVRCDEAEGNTRQQIFTCSGHVLILGNGANVVGERVTVDFINENYVAENTETQLTPEQMEYRLTDKLYVSGKLSAGTRYLTHTQDGTLTTCDLDRPHYNIEARDLEVRTGRRAILRDARVRLFGKTILRVPFLVIPLDDRTYRNLPYFGHTDDEGYFVKNTYGIPMKGNAALVTHEDFMEKLGVGLGVEYGYAAPSVSGVTRVYKIFGKAKTFNFSNDHRQAFRWGSVSLQNDYQKDNYLTAPGQTLLNTRAALTYNNLFGDRATTRLTLNRNENKSTGYSNTTQTIGLSDQRRFGDLRTDSQVNLLSTSSSYTGGTQTDTERVQVKLLASQEVGLGTAQVQYQRTIPVGETQGFLGSSDLTPVLSLQSDGRHLFGAEAGKEIPIRTELSWGEYSDSRTKSQTERTSFGLTYAKSTPSVERLTFDTSARFRQSLYSDDTAQYILGLNENIRYRLGSDTGINVRYGYLRPYGYTPLTLDSTGQTNFVSTDINVRPIRSLLLGAQTGYDLLRLQRSEIAWQQLGLRSEWTPRSGILFRSLLTYDTFQQAFSQLRFDFSSIGRDTRLNLNAQYDGIQHTWSTLNGSVDGLRFGRTKIAALFTYNGYLKKFDTKQYAFTYDLHCAEAVLAIQENNFGFRPGRQIFLMIRLKALPFDVPFGTGTRGQGVGFGSGTNF
jgi:LPS-assembly protein